MGPYGRGGMGMGRPAGARHGPRNGRRRGAGNGRSPEPGPSNSRNTSEDGTTRRLPRFFDATVNHGNRYRYRVPLVFQDVNADQPPKFLDPTVTARQTQSKSLLDTA